MASSVVHFDGSKWDISPSLIRQKSSDSKLVGKGLKKWVIWMLLALISATRYGRLGLGFALCTLAMCAVGLALHNLVSESGKQKFVAYILPTVMSGLDKAMGDVRKELLKEAKGKVLDVGAGSGAYVKYLCQSSRVEKYVAMEPCEGLHRHIENAIGEAGTTCDYDIVGGFLDQVEGSDSFDTVVLGNVLCEVPDERSALKEVKRLLKSGGRCYFSEHVLDEDQLCRRMLQYAISPWWMSVSGGCRCNRRQLVRLKEAFGEGNVVHWTLYAGSFAWTARFEVGLAVKS